jgi:site-specific recombinase XerD
MAGIKGVLNRDYVSIEVILDKYVGYLHKYRSLAEYSIYHHRLYTRRFLEHYGCDNQICLPEILKADNILMFASEYALGHGHESSHYMFSTLRVFLRYLHMDGQVHQDLSEAVPTLHRHQLSRVPRGIREEEIKQLLDSIDLSEDTGMRDYAIIQMLSTYGVRGVHIRKLRLDDIYWHENKIVFMTVKGGKSITQYLTPAVGNSILDYLQHARQNHAPCREVFLTSRGAPKALQAPSSVSGIIARRLKRAGIKLPAGVSQGSHSFRHAFATRMVCGSQPFKYVSDMLGHRVIDSTMIYTKINLPAMRQATLEWPEESA